VPRREQALYRQELADSAFALRDEQGQPLAFVTVCRQQENAWIGNLIVDPARRGHGYGRQLFLHAVGILSARGANALWLTASADGRPLYESLGFHEVGRVERWICTGIDRARESTVAAGNGELYALVRADAAAWGHSRAGLLTLLARGGQIVAAGSTVALLQPGEDFHILGPWLSADLSPRANRIVLGMAMEVFSGAGEIAVDVIKASPVRPLLHAAGFRQVGESVLMMCGEAGKVRLTEVVALASLGSMG
jgi:N-acetylglutamate synthase-like GNAT family acetyltransferase